MASLANMSHHLAAASHVALTCSATPGSAAVHYTAFSPPPSSSRCPLVLQFRSSCDHQPQEIRSKRTKRDIQAKREGAKGYLKLNLTRPKAPMTGNTPPRRSSSSSSLSPTSPPSSCISSEMSQDDLTQLGYYSSSPEAQSMVLAGCQRCLMYVMLSEDDPKCPKCQNTVLLEFMQQGNHTGSSSGSSSTNKTRKNR